MNANVIDVAVSILEKHIQASPLPNIQSPNQAKDLTTDSLTTNILTTAISIIESSIAKSLHKAINQSTESTNISDKNTDQKISQNVIYDGMLRRGPIEMDGKLSIASSTGQLKPPTETTVYSVNVAPKYGDNVVRPIDYTITPTINTIVDKTNEIDVLNEAIEKQQKNIDTLAEKIKTATTDLSTPQNIQT